jgi:hypothetical protein
MSAIKIDDIAFVRFRAPDLNRMRGFLQDFGLRVTGQDEQRLFARGAGTSPVLHITEVGEAGLAGLGLRAAGVRLLARPVGPHSGALDGRRPAYRRRWLQQRIPAGSRRRAMGSARPSDHGLTPTTT